MGAERSICLALSVRHRSRLMSLVLGIVTRAIASHLVKAAGVTRATAQTGAVTLIQRFGSALCVIRSMSVVDSGINR